MKRNNNQTGNVPSTLKIVVSAYVGRSVAAKIYGCRYTGLCAHLRIDIGVSLVQESWDWAPCCHSSDSCSQVMSTRCLDGGFNVWLPGLATVCSVRPYHCVYINNEGLFTPYSQQKYWSVVGGHWLCSLLLQVAFTIVSAGFAPI